MTKIDRECLAYHERALKAWQGVPQTPTAQRMIDLHRKSIEYIREREAK